MRNLNKKLLIVAMLSLGAFTAHASAATDVDRNIKIIFPPDLMQQMIDETTPELLTSLKYTNGDDKAKTESTVNTFHTEFLQNFQTLVTASLKQSFTPEELAQWAAFQTTPLGEKTMLWLKTKYPGILNKAMEGPMQNMYKNIGGQ
jgi:hypothetical protein